jgi:manganese-dependent ADP-ribose/CDP-alcohol diphosphatase
MNKMKTRTIRFGVVADAQFSSAPDDIQHNRFFTQVTGRLAEARDYFNEQSLDFVINLGDIIDKDWVSFDQILPVFDSIHASKYHVLGNHDFFVKDDEKPKVYQRLGMPSPYYHFILHSWRFLVLNAMDLSVEAYPKGTKEYQASDSLFTAIKENGLIQAQGWNGAIGEVQQKWIREQLSEATQKQQKVIIFSHIPFAPLHMNTLWNNEDITSLLEKYSCVKACFYGHYHEGGHVVKNGIHHYNFKGMLDTPDQNAFAIVELSDQSITITGFGREGNSELIF